MTADGGALMAAAASGSNARAIICQLGLTLGSRLATPPPPPPLRARSFYTAHCVNTSTGGPVSHKELV